MDFLLGFSIIMLLVINSVSFWFLFKLKKNIEKVHARIDGIFTVDLPAPNEATKKTNSGIPLNEENALNIPPDVKFEVEAGDEQIPPGYTRGGHS